MGSYGYRESIDIQTKSENKTYLPTFLSSSDTVKWPLIEAAIYFINPDKSGPLNKKKASFLFWVYPDIIKKLRFIQ
jgi:hypothetical protein